MPSIQAADLLYPLAIMIAMGGVGWFIGYGMVPDSIRGKLWFAFAFFTLTGVALVGHALHLF